MSQKTILTLCNMHLLGGRNKDLLVWEFYIPLQFLSLLVHIMNLIEVFTSSEWAHWAWCRTRWSVPLCPCWPRTSTDHCAQATPGRSQIQPGATYYYYMSRYFWFLGLLGALKEALSVCCASDDLSSSSCLQAVIFKSIQKAFKKCSKRMFKEC